MQGGIDGSHTALRRPQSRSSTSRKSQSQSREGRTPDRRRKTIGIVPKKTSTESAEGAGRTIGGSREQRTVRHVVAKRIDSKPERQLDNPAPLEQPEGPRGGAQSPMSFVDGVSVVGQQWVDSLLALGLRGVRKQFIETVRPYKPSGSRNACNDHPNLNRYDDVFLLDRTRVRLRNHPDGDDYVHASYVEIHPECVYICAQGPMTHTVSHFWYMVMQENARVVLQLCQLVEDEKEKCCEYYPSVSDGAPHEWKSYGSVQVRVVDREPNVMGIEKVTQSRMQVRTDENPKQIHDVVHLYYYGWPDHSVAESVTACRELRTLIHRLYEKRPIVTHCSAGIGRTGTFAMIELVIHRLLVKQEVCKMVEMAKELRDQRMHAIQTDQQYAFVYRCVLEILMIEEGYPKTRKIDKFIHDYESLIQRKNAQRGIRKGAQTL